MELPQGQMESLHCFDKKICKIFCSLYRLLKFGFTALLVNFDRKRRNRWSEAIWSNNFSHSSCKAWNVLNNLTGRSRHSSRHFPVSADAIASQLVRNGRYESSRLVSQKVSNLWKPTTLNSVNISENFSQREFTAALQHFNQVKLQAMIPFAQSL